MIHTVLKIGEQLSPSTVCRSPNTMRKYFGSKSTHLRAKKWQVSASGLESTLERRSVTWSRRATFCTCDRNLLGWVPIASRTLQP